MWRAQDKNDIKYIHKIIHRHRLSFSAVIICLYKINLLNLYIFNLVVSWKTWGICALTEPELDSTSQHGPIFLAPQGIDSWLSVPSSQCTRPPCSSSISTPVKVPYCSYPASPRKRWSHRTLPSGSLRKPHSLFHLRSPFIEKWQDFPS